MNLKQTRSRAVHPRRFFDSMEQNPSVRVNTRFQTAMRVLQRTAGYTWLLLGTVSVIRKESCTTVSLELMLWLQLV